MWTKLIRARLGCVLVIALATSGCQREPGQPSAAEKAIADLQAKYEELKDRRAADAVEWAKEDLEKIGDWEYRVVEFPAEPIADLEAELNALGEDRWEAFWITASGPQLRVLMKRPAVSYISRVPFSRLGRIVTDGGQ